MDFFAEILKKIIISVATGLIIFLAANKYSFIKITNFGNGNNSGSTELLYWQSVQNHPSPELYNSYLKKYPNGEFKEIAEKILAEAKPTTKLNNYVVSVKQLELEDTKHKAKTIKQDVFLSRKNNAESILFGKNSSKQQQQAAINALIELIKSSDNSTIRSDSMRLLGLSYFLGKGVPNDKKTGCQWYKKAAENNSQKAEDFYEKKCK